MSKYSVKTIIDYVNGNDLECNIEELENDYRFMMEVIFYTNDKKMYNLCSNEVKANFTFIKFIINKFKDDLTFVFNVSKFFLCNNKFELEKFELVLIFRELVKGKLEDYDDEYYDCMMILNRIYKTEKTIIEIIKSDEENKDIFDEYGLGFIFIYDKYSGSEKILDFFADRFIDEILESDVNLERIIHKKFASYSLFEVYGINNFCLEFLREYDIILSDYVSSNLNLLNTLKRRIRLVKRNWDNYIFNLKKRQYGLIYDVIESYIKENNSCFYALGVILCIGKELGVLDDVINYGLYNDDCYEVDSFIKECCIIKKENGLLALKQYYDMKKIVLDILSSCDIYECEMKYYGTDGKIKIR